MNEHLNEHQENPRNEAAKAFNESLKKLEELWEETAPADNPPEELLEELAAAAADIELFLAGDSNASTNSEVNPKIEESTKEISQEILKEIPKEVSSDRQKNP